MLASMKPRGGAVDMPGPTANVGNMALAHCNTSHGRVCTEKILSHIFWPWPHVKHPKGISKIHLSSCIVKNQSSESLWESVREQNIWIESEHVRTWNWNLGVPDQRMPQEWWAILEVQAWAWQRKIMTLQSNHEPLQKGEFCNTVCVCILINTTTLLRSQPGKMNSVISYNYR